MAIKKARKSGGGRAYASQQQRYVRGITPAAICDLLPQLMARYGFQRQLGSEKLQTAWNELLGPLADQTRLGSKKRGTLEVKVRHNIIMQELSFRNTELVSQLKLAVPEEKIVRIRYVVGEF